MYPRTRRVLRLRRGAAAIEFAILLPVLLSLFVIVLDFARVYSASQIVTDAARMGAMYTSHPDLADKSGYESLEQAVESLTRPLSPRPQVASREYTDAAGVPYRSVTVTYSYPMICGWFGKRSFTIKRTIHARHWPDGEDE